MSNKKVYLAARYTRRTEIKEYAKQLALIGVEVTSSWLNQTTPAHTDMDKPEQRLRKYAKRDYDDIVSADYVVMFTNEDEPKRSGHDVEFGIGLMAGKECIVCESPTNIFHYFPGVKQFDNFGDVLEYFEGKKNV